jgi:hypothetical protein
MSPNFLSAESVIDVAAMGLKRLEFDYKLSKATDEYGNRFRYRGKLREAAVSLLLFTTLCGANNPPSWYSSVYSMMSGWR